MLDDQLGIKATEILLDKMDKSVTHNHVRYELSTLNYKYSTLDP